MISLKVFERTKKNILEVRLVSALLFSEAFTVSVRGVQIRKRRLSVSNFQKGCGGGGVS